MEGTEERISELEDRTIEITRSEQQRENRLKKVNRASGTFWTITKDLPFTSTESWKEIAREVREIVKEQGMGISN